MSKFRLKEKSAKLTNRADEIIKDIRKFINTNGLI